MSRTSSRVLRVLPIAAGLLLVGCPSAPPDAGGDIGAPLGKATAMAGPVGTPPAARVVGTKALPTSTPAAKVDPTHALITGKITGPDGLPVADVAVIIVEGTSPWPEMATFSSAAGEYQWLVDPGTYTLQASRDGYGTARGEITAVGGEPAKLDLTLPKP